MKINKEIFDHLADMLRIEFTKEEKKQLIDDINKTVEFIDTMNEMDTENVEPFLFVHQRKNAFREDIVINTEMDKNLLSIAPEISNGYYAVPKAIE